MHAFMKRLTVLVLLSLPTLAFGDGGFFPPEDYSGKDLTEPSQKAVVVHAEGKETLFLFVDYHGDAKRFAWVVPCPAKPEVDTADAPILKEVADYFHHLRMEAWKKMMANRKGEGRWGARGGGEPERLGVTVHLTKIAGPYEISVVSALNEGGLSAWLRTNGYRIPEGMDSVLKAYVDEGWFFAAVKVRAETGRNVTLKPLRLDFRTQDPIYPLRISAATRGVMDIRVYAFLDRSIRGPGEEPSPHGDTFRVEGAFLQKCPSLAKVRPGLSWTDLWITRLHDQLIPQVMRRLDDRIHILPAESAVRFYSHTCLAKTVGVAEALVSDRPAEARWAEENIYYYAHAKPRPGEFQKEHREALTRLGKAFGAGLRDRLIELIRRDRTARNASLPCDGAIILLARTVDPADPVVIRFLEETEGVYKGGDGPINALMDMGTPPARRALARIALAPGKKYFGSVFRYVYSLERNPIGEEEKPIVVKELLAMLSQTGVTGDALGKGLRFLRQTTGQDFGQDWEAWKKWLEKK
ncbi:MAG: DUF2330 domain-containing protein [Planctomycetota bacterium]|jgi:hypothetical protein